MDGSTGTAVATWDQLSPRGLPEVSVVIVAYGAMPELEPSVRAVLASQGVEVEVVIVDNGETSGVLARLAEEPGVTVLPPAGNLGFAGGCNAGVAATRHPRVAFVNPDAMVDPDALARLVTRLEQPDVGFVSASVRLADDPGLLNSCGNPVHFTGISWAGGLGEPASAHARVAEVASVSGAACLIRRDLFDELGGFCEDYFLYGEDTELSLRCWLHGRRVLYEPAAVVRHAYDFGRNPGKLFLLERNRLMTVLTLLEPGTLLALAPGLLAFEAAMLVVATRDGWIEEKLRGYAWLLRHADLVRRRRARVQADRVLSDAQALLPRLAGRVTPGRDSGQSVPAVVNDAMALYWRVTRPVAAALGRRRLGAAVGRRSGAPARR